ncbi:hypothetical protein pclt_cds_1000 [Pandoravirus celtis]|uniref:Uncharacterized protein n=1 Tax=Pandoravirus celtis TaxID=2568002 RepID=A0A4D6EIC2_9VIRU|nr:hypothetical protein pclt_cds_1000 [Pandoravirus celtis]
MRYARMWSHLADSRACIAFLSSRVDAWPPTLADVEQAYRDLDDAYRERCRTHDGDDDNDNNEEEEENAAQSLIAYLIDDARAGDPYPGDMLADALGQALQRMAAGVMSQRWPQYRDPFAGRSVPRHAHGSGCVSSTAEGDLDYYVVVARRSDTVEAVLLAVIEGSGACAVAGASLLHEAPCDRIAASMPVDVAGLCPSVRPYAFLLPTFLGAIANVLHIAPQPAVDEDAMGSGEVIISGARHVADSLQPLPSLFDMPRSVIAALDEIDDRVYAWRQPDELGGLWIEPGQLALALSLAAGARAAGAVDPPPSSLADRAAAVYDGPLDAPGLCADAAALIAARIWRRVCADAADDMGRLPGAERLVDVALALDVAPTDVERAVPELLCGRLIEPAVRAMVRARGLGIVADVQTMDTSGHPALDPPVIEAMGVAARLAPEDDPTSNGVMVLADVIARQGGRVDVERDLSCSHRLAGALTRTLWPSASIDERAAWARLYAADPASHPDPPDVALLEALASRMGIQVGDHHRATAGALCGLLALAVHWPA